MKRKIIEINEDKCTGCGLCIPDCPEGALQVIDGKARLISDLFCDGLGACVGACPEGAMEVIEREAEDYDERKVMENIIKAGSNTIKAHLQHLKDHNECDFFNTAVQVLKEKGLDVPDVSEKGNLACGCPGNMEKKITKKNSSEGDHKIDFDSELQQWPVQLKLLNPDAGFFKNAELLIAADCTPFAYADFHRRFIKNKIAITLCPKLDTDLEGYVNKLVEIFRKQDIKSITVVHMEVPCCNGIVQIVEKAIRSSGKNIILRDYTISIDGKII